MVPYSMSNTVDGWKLTAHCCARCLGRILRRGDTYICACCEDTATGEVERLCACGLRPADTKSAPGGFRCTLATAPRPGQPVIVARFGEAEDDPVLPGGGVPFGQSVSLPGVSF
jgi:hypothetical protein